jgi:hypothetical protein
MASTICGREGPPDDTESSSVSSTHFFEQHAIAYPEDVVLRPQWQRHAAQERKSHKGIQQCEDGAIWSTA